MPIVDLMAVSNTHFQKLRDFITCSLPAGFPVKIEIPLFHVLNARVTFGNIFGSVDPVEGVSVVGGPVVDGGENEDDRKVSCVLDDSVFAIPEDYSRIGVQTCSEQARRQWEGDDDDQLLLQYALRQSGGDGAENGIPEDMAREEVDIWEALQVGTCLVCLTNCDAVQYCGCPPLRRRKLHRRSRVTTATYPLVSIKVMKTNNSNYKSRGRSR